MGLQDARADRPIHPCGSLKTQNPQNLVKPPPTPKTALTHLGSWI
jgi:hypothetical protein